VNVFIICNRQLLATKRQLVGVENELQTLQDTYKDKQDSWIKEKLDLQVSDHYIHLYFIRKDRVMISLYPYILASVFFIIMLN
jgi:hypothetical protein